MMTKIGTSEILMHTHFVDIYLSTIIIIIIIIIWKNYFIQFLDWISYLRCNYGVNQCQIQNVGLFSRLGSSASW